MTTILTPNVRATRDSHVPPPALRENGENYPWRMFFDGNRQIADSDNLSELLDLIIPTYGDLETEDQRYAARLELAKSVQLAARTQVVLGLSQEEVDGLTDQEWQWLSWEDFSDPSGLTEDGAPIVWKSKAPLVLIDTFYAPFSALLPPLSSHGDVSDAPNIVWLKPSSEVEFLYSLHYIGYLSFGEPAAPDRPVKKAIDYSPDA